VSCDRTVGEPTRGDPAYLESQQTNSLVLKQGPSAGSLTRDPTNHAARATPKEPMAETSIAPANKPLASPFQQHENHGSAGEPIDEPVGESSRTPGEPAGEIKGGLMQLGGDRRANSDTHLRAYGNTN
jgi:hypothetical protein